MTLIFHETDPEFMKEEPMGIWSNIQDKWKSRSVQPCYESDNNTYQVTEEEFNVQGQTVWLGFWAENVMAFFSLRLGVKEKLMSCHVLIYKCLYKCVYVILRRSYFAVYELWMVEIGLTEIEEE